MRAFRPATPTRRPIRAAAVSSLPQTTDQGFRAAPGSGPGHCGRGADVRLPSCASPATSCRPARRAAATGPWWLIGFVVVLIILLVSLRSLARIYTDSLWFSSVDYHDVFSTLLIAKLGLFGVFGRSSSPCCG